jgi:hypothetical protein
MSTDLMNDLATRMVPAPGNVMDARDMIRRTGTEMAITPIAFPGKEYGIWTADTEVLTKPNAAVFACNNDDSYRRATTLASGAAAEWLGERPGTVGFVVHRIVDGEVYSAVFEEILSPLKALEFAAAVR